MTNIIKIYVLLFLAFLLKTEAGQFSTIPKMEKLLETQEKVINNVKTFVNKEKERLLYLENFVKLLKKEQLKAERNIPHYVGNPINAFTLVKRLTGDLQFLESILKNKTGYIRDKTVMYPSEKDVIDATMGIVRLQTTYKLNVTQLANGIVSSTFSADRKPYKESVSPMSASDCYDVGLVAYGDENYQTTILWMMEALKKYTATKCVLCNFTDVQIIDYIGQSHYFLGNINETIYWTKKTIELQPRHPDNPRRILFVNSLEDQLQQKLAAQKYKMRKSDGGETSTKIKKELSPEEKVHYLCGGYYNISKSVKKRLMCYYAHGPHPFLRLAPIKAEQLYIRPDIFMFYDMVSHDDIHTIRYIAKLHTLSEINKPKGPAPRYGQDRCHNTHISTVNENSQVITKLVRRASHVTGLSMENSEDLRILSYGIGGTYERHHDSDSKDVAKDFIDKYGDRISTILYYLSPVEGGATVFPDLYLTIYPVERAALFFNNLLPSGVTDDDSAHASCPVLRGTKWIALKWPHEVPQQYCPVWKTQKGIMTAQKYAQFTEDVKLRIKDKEKLFAS